MLVLISKSLNLGVIILGSFKECLSVFCWVFEVYFSLSKLRRYVTGSGLRSILILEAFRRLAANIPTSASVSLGSRDYIEGALN